MQYVLEMSWKRSQHGGMNDSIAMVDTWGPMRARPTAKEVFGSNKYSPADWHQKSDMTVIARTGTMDTFGHAIGFISGHIRRERGKAGPLTWHIWMTGVFPSARRQGIFTAMVNQFIKHAPEQVHHLSVCTYPDKFPEMYSWIKSFGFKEYPIVGSDPFGKKYFEMPICGLIIKPHITTHYHLVMCDQVGK